MTSAPSRPFLLRFARERAEPEFDWGVYDQARQLRVLPGTVPLPLIASSTGEENPTTGPKATGASTSTNSGKDGDASDSETD